MKTSGTLTDDILEQYAPVALRDVNPDQNAIPRLAKKHEILAEIDRTLPRLPTVHRFFNADATRMAFLKPASLHLVITSPPYWTLKHYRENERQLGHISDYDTFLRELDRVWRKCYRALVPGGRLICVVGDVCLSRRKNNGRHTVVPLHSSIQEHCRKIGFDNLAPIIWNKIANATFEVKGGSSFLGKPYEPNAVIKNDVEFILMERKPGGYRNPSFIKRLFSIISEENHRVWFNQIWTGLNGASTRSHPAPYPLELASRLIRMFSFVGDTVLDPFMGSGTSAIAAYLTGRNSINVEIDQQYFEQALQRFSGHADNLETNHELEIYKAN